MIKKFDELQRRAGIRGSLILKAFGFELEKARHGVYSDNPVNKKLGRVGQEYGTKKKEEDSVVKDKKSDESSNKDQKIGKYEQKLKKEFEKQQERGLYRKDITWEEFRKNLPEKDKIKIAQEKLSQHAKNASESNLQSVIKNHKDPIVREAAHIELERRKKEEYPDKNKKIKYSKSTGSEKADKLIDKFINNYVKKDLKPGTEDKFKQELIAVVKMDFEDSDINKIKMDDIVETFDVSIGQDNRKYFKI